ncbi:hypothetical protein Cadr_000009610 [Camelus dromedarius]|uniref:Uncharacterized protein n=1 Tax=Camelus dromedarius TaxID=9838 RepID=A0A5N4DJG6_CAMDR|nr:hypothetical protein Cadr_000009610 [Camelus dromedarius]
MECIPAAVSLQYLEVIRAAVAMRQLDLQLISMCKFQRVQIVTVLEVPSFLKRGHTGAAEHSGGPADTQELCHKAVLGRGCWTSYFGL